MKLQLLRNFVFLLVVLTFFTACREELIVSPDTKLAAEYDNEVVVSWNELLLEVERFTPGDRDCLLITT